VDNFFEVHSCAHKNGSREQNDAPFREALLSIGWDYSYGQPVNQTRSLYMFTHYEAMKGNEKCKKFGGSPKVIGNIAIRTAHMTSYSSILYRFRVIARFLSKVTNCTPPHLITFEFHHELWCQSPRAIVRHYLRDPTFSRFDAIPECDRHTTSAYTALNTALCRWARLLTTDIGISTPALYNASYRIGIRLFFNETSGQIYRCQK